MTNSPESQPRASSPSCHRTRWLPAIAGILVLLLASAAEARRGAPPKSRSLSAVKALDTVPMKRLPAVDTKALLAEDEASLKVGPMRYAVPVPVKISPETHGVWEELSDGGRLWRYRFVSEGATDLNFGFTKFWFSSGATLHVISEKHDYYEGPYTAGDNETHGQLWVPVVPGDSAVVEMYVPKVVKEEPILELTQVATGYRDLHKVGPGAASTKQGPCNNDTICPEGDPWRDQIRAAGVYSINGIFACSGQMIRDVPGTFRNFFLTANHCGLSAGNAASMTVFWNFESPNCGDLSGGSLAQNQTGATFRAARSDVDVALVELDDPPDPAFQVFYGGWDRTGNVPVGQTVGIHHPGTDEKAISFNEDPLTTGATCIGGGSTPDSHWFVDNWEDGTTEGGSSGSGLWDTASKRLIGFLSGGLASCTNISFDCYGRFSEAWDGASAATRLRDWLDPGDTQPDGIDGGDPSPAIFYASHDGVDSCSSDTSLNNSVWEPGETISITVEVRGSGDFTGVSGTLTSPSAGVTVLSGPVAMPDITPGMDFSAGPFDVLLDQTVTCFDDVSFNLAVTANEGGPFDLPFSNIVGAPLVPPASVPIPDGAGANMPGPPALSPITIADDVTLTDVNVRVNITHTFVGDLQISLRGPDGVTEVLLLDRPGQPATNAGCSNNDVMVTFDDSSAVNPEDTCTGITGDPWPVTDAAPVEALSAFNGMSSAGTWNLVVVDNFNADTGSIVEWELITTPGVSGQCAVCMGDPPEVNLSLDKQCALDPGGATGTCALTVTNAGPDDATGVTVNDDLPAGIGYLNDDCGLIAAGQSLSWNVGALAVGASATCNVAVSVAEGAQTAVNVATASAVGADTITASSPIQGVPNITEIPTLDSLGLWALLLGLSGAGLYLLRRRG